MVTEHRFASPQTNVTKQGNRILILDEEQAGNFAADQSELTDFDSVRRMLGAPLRWHSGFPAVPTFRMRLPCVTKQNNQGRTIRHDCIPLPTKSATASNPNRRGRLYEQRARLQSRQQHQRQTHHRQTASAIAKSAGTVVVETLNVAGMVRNRRLAKALSGRSSRRVPAGTGMAVREARRPAAQSGAVVPQHTDLCPVRWASQRTHRPVGAVVSLPPMRLAV